MITASSRFKELAKAPIKQYRLTITDIEDGTQYTSSDNIISADLEAVGAVLNVTTKQLTIKLLNSDYNLLDRRIRVDLALLDPDTQEYEAICLGNYTITEQTANKENDTTTIKAVDKIGELAKSPYSEALVFPCPVSDLVNQIGARFNISTANIDWSTVPNASYEIAEDLWAKISNTTYRDILAQVAGATASIIEVVGQNDELQITKANGQTAEAWSWDNLLSIKLQDKYGAINSVVLSRTPAEDNIALTDEEEADANGVKEIKIANNEILDDDRETLIQPIFNVVNGYWYYPFEATTEGHGWYQAGDRIRVENSDKSWEVVVSSIKLTIDGGIKEQIKGEALQKTATDYKLAGGITKTIYNTEIKVDKQGQNITSVVSRMDNLENQVIENYTEIKQDISSVTTSVQETGGNNLIINSVGYDTDSKENIVDWEETGEVSSSTSPESVNSGAISGNQITLGALSTITQRIPVDSTGQEYSISAKIKKGVTGNATLTLSNGNDNFSFTVPHGEESEWKTFDIKGFIPTDNYLDLTISTDAEVEELAITDLMMNIGNGTTPWVQASGETLNTQVAITKNGVKVKSSVYAGDYVEITPLEFAGYSTASGSSQKVFSLNRDTTVVQKLHAEQQIEMPPIKIVPITQGDRTGWAFVKLEEED